MDIEPAEANPDEAEIIAVVSAAVAELVAGGRAVELQVDQDSLRWRFSGRWWNQPIAIGRRRPGLF